jgi:small subunit ribosomal protein S8
MTDSIADMLTRIRNACRARHKEVVVPLSRVKSEMLKILKEEGYIKDFTEEEGFPRKAKVILKYGPGGKSVVSEMKRVSRPGKRVYTGKENIPAVLGGFGVAILSTSKGIMTDKKAREAGVGGELLCTVS